MKGTNQAVQGKVCNRNERRAREDKGRKRER
jgi:hypothetical protein